LNREKQREGAIQKHVREACGFVPDPRLSAFQNAKKIIGDTITWYYFSSPKNVAFHDLTHGMAVPKIAE